MLAKAKQKIQFPAVQFHQANITREWAFADRRFDLVTFSPVPEYLEDLNPVFVKAASVSNTTGQVYIGKLHPFKQYLRTKARLETTGSTQLITCFNHHASEFIQPALARSMVIEQIKEHFDYGKKTEVPRILS